MSSHTSLFSVEHMQLLSWPAYSPDISPIEHSGGGSVDFVDRDSACYPPPLASSYKVWVSTQKM